MKAVAKMVTAFARIATASPTPTATSSSIQPITRNGSNGMLSRSGQPTAPAGACDSIFRIAAAARQKTSAAAPAITQ
jgi:hypothetical protein